MRWILSEISLVGLKGLGPGTEPPDPLLAVRRGEAPFLEGGEVTLQRPLRPGNLLSDGRSLLLRFLRTLGMLAVGLRQRF